MTKRTEYDASFKLEVARMVVDQGLNHTGFRGGSNS
jgi:hypothetical protein